MEWRGDWLGGTCTTDFLFVLLSLYSANQFVLLCIFGFFFFPAFGGGAISNGWRLRIHVGYNLELRVPGARKKKKKEGGPKSKLLKWKLCGKTLKGEEYQTWVKQTHSYKPAKEKKRIHKKTRDGGCLGSHIDEERSKMRYVMRIAELVSHQIFERKLRSWAILRACLFECPLKIQKFAIPNALALWICGVWVCEFLSWVQVEWGFRIIFLSSLHEAPQVPSPQGV